MKNKQTAVNWLVEQLQAPCRGIPSHIIEQSKQMEKDQIIEAYETSHISMMTAEQYYNETYELDKNNK